MKKQISENGYCFVCGGNGFNDKDCPSCNKIANNKSLNLDLREDTTEFVAKIDSFGIPGKYRGIVWDAEMLKNTKQGKLNDHNFLRFAEQLQKINNLFVKGLLSPKSAIIIAPAGYSKMTFAYSCMQRALDNGFSVAPLLDTIELKRLLVLASENPIYKLYNTISYDEYLMSDVMFVTVTKMKQRSWAYEVIQEILDRRTRKGLSTFIISRYNLAEMSQRDYSNQFDALASAVSEDSFKYPAVILYEEIFKRRGD